MLKAITKSKRIQNLNNFSITLLFMFFIIPRTNGQFLSHDLEKYNLMGPVKKLDEYYFNYSSDWLPKGWIHNKYFDFNSSEYLVKSKEYGSYYEYIYQNDTLEKRLNKYSSDKVLDDYFTYEYDSFGRLTKYFAHDTKKGLDYWYLNEYDKNNNLVLQTTYDGDGSFFSERNWKCNKIKKDSIYNWRNINGNYGYEKYYYSGNKLNKCIYWSYSNDEKKSTKDSTIFTHNSNGTMQRKIAFYSYNTSFNEYLYDNGKLIKEIYNQENQKNYDDFYRNEKMYDSYGNETEIKYFYKNSTKNFSQFYKYDYDRYGNYIIKYASTSPYIIWKNDTKREIEYFY